MLFDELTSRFSVLFSAHVLAGGVIMVIGTNISVSHAFAQELADDLTKCP